MSKKKKFSLSLSDDIIHALKKADGNTLSQSELKDMLGTSQHKLTRDIKYLKDLGWVNPTPRGTKLTTGRDVRDLEKELHQRCRASSDEEIKTSDELSKFGQKLEKISQKIYDDLGSPLGLFHRGTKDQFPDEILGRELYQEKLKEVLKKKIGVEDDVGIMVRHGDKSIGKIPIDLLIKDKYPVGIFHKRHLGIKDREALENILNYVDGDKGWLINFPRSTATKKAENEVEIKEITI